MKQLKGEFRATLQPTIKGCTKLVGDLKTFIGEHIRTNHPGFKLDGYDISLVPEPTPAEEIQRTYIIVEATFTDDQELIDFRNHVGNLFRSLGDKLINECNKAYGMDSIALTKERAQPWVLNPDELGWILASVEQKKAISPEEFGTAVDLLESAYLKVFPTVSKKAKTKKAPDTKCPVILEFEEQQADLMQLTLKKFVYTYPDYLKEAIEEYIKDIIQDEVRGMTDEGRDGIPEFDEVSGALEALNDAETHLTEPGNFYADLIRVWPAEYDKPECPDLEKAIRELDGLVGLAEEVSNMQDRLDEKKEELKRGLDSI